MSVLNKKYLNTIYLNVELLLHEVVHTDQNSSNLLYVRGHVSIIIS